MSIKGHQATIEQGSNRHVLHICGDYQDSSIYRELLSNLAEDRSVSHTMYVPRWMSVLSGGRANGPPDNVQLICSRDYHWVERFMHHRKLRKITAAIQRQVSIQSVDLVHAHFLFSAGGVAYALKKLLNIDYLVAVRNSDLNMYFRLAPHLRGFGLRVLDAAAKVVFISPSYRDVLLAKYVPDRLRASIKEKSVVLPNGINNFWLENRQYRPPRKDRNTVKLLLVGEWTKNRNILMSIKVTRLLRDRGYDVHLDIVGGGPEERRIRKAAGGNADIVSVHGWAEKDQLLHFYRSADIFLMPSFHDTFGLVYIEAMSQGMPVLYTRGEGIDGYFPDGSVGYACDPRDPERIADRIVDILKNYNAISGTATNSVEDFSWRRIAKEYKGIYEELYA